MREIEFKGFREGDTCSLECIIEESLCDGEATIRFIHNRCDVPDHAIVSVKNLTLISRKQTELEKAEEMRDAIGDRRGCEYDTKAYAERLWKAIEELKGSI